MCRRDSRNECVFLDRFFLLECYNRDLPQLKKNARFSFSISKQQTTTAATLMMTNEIFPVKLIDVEQILPSPSVRHRFKSLIKSRTAKERETESCLPLKLRRSRHPAFLRAFLLVLVIHLFRREDKRENRNL